MQKLPNSVAMILASANTPPAIVEFFSDTEVFEVEDRNDSYVWLYGGGVYLIEHPSELEVVFKAAQGLYGGLAFDLMRDIGTHLACTVITNNAGGPTFFIPMDIWRDSPRLATAFDQYKAVMESERFAAEAAEAAADAADAADEADEADYKREAQQPY